MKFSLLTAKYLNKSKICLLAHRGKAIEKGEEIAILFFFQSVYTIILQPSAKHFAHPVQSFFLNQLPIQHTYPLLTEICVAEICVEVLLREENVFLRRQCLKYELCASL
ncbi:MAG: hypothetical protein IJF88_07785 [Oscillospiraceae bacterium]|nr:hypothetical protein [Oscillospiraceae bacterium]